MMITRFERIILFLFYMEKLARLLRERSFVGGGVMFVWGVFLPVLHILCTVVIINVNCAQ